MAISYAEPSISEGASIAHPDRISGSVFVGPGASVSERAQIHGHIQDGYGFGVRLRNQAAVSGRAHIDSGNVLLMEDALITDEVRVDGGLEMGGTAQLSGGVYVRGDCNYIWEDAKVRGTVSVTGNTQIQGTSVLSGGFQISDATIRRDGELRNADDFVTFRYREGTVTLHRTEGGGALVNAGCQSFGLDEPESFYKELAYAEGWKLPEYWDLILAAFRKHAEKHF